LSVHSNDAAIAEHWMPRLEGLCRDIRAVTRRTMADAIAAGDESSVARPIGQGAGDVTYGIDRASERVIERWLEITACSQPVSLLTEETGWRHMAPSSGGARDARDVEGFDHGGPRIVVDPIDGTRNLMTDLRSAWTVLGIAGPGVDAPRMSDIRGGIVCEIPDSRGARGRVLSAVRGSPCWLRDEPLDGAPSTARREIRTGADARVDHGYFPFFKYLADMRPAISAIEARFFERLATHEHADVRNCYDDQYISNGGHLALLSLGTYRMIADLRAHLATLRGRPTMTTKPYDIAGAVVCARAAGCVITDTTGRELDFPIDVTTPVSFVGWVNAATRERLEPHLLHALANV
jgi:fructose-1,6-bisphosphatase/inositol monophosphatase family enzyme